MLAVAEPLAGIDVGDSGPRQRRPGSAVELEDHGLALGVARHRCRHGRGQARQRGGGGDASPGVWMVRRRSGALATGPRVQRRGDGVGPGSGRDRRLGTGQPRDRSRASRADGLRGAARVKPLDRVAVRVLAQQRRGRPVDGDAAPGDAHGRRGAGRHRGGLGLTGGAAGARPRGGRDARSHAGREHRHDNQARSRLTGGRPGSSRTTMGSGRLGRSWASRGPCATRPTWSGWLGEGV